MKNSAFEEEQLNLIIQKLDNSDVVFSIDGGNIAVELMYKEIRDFVNLNSLANLVNKEGTYFFRHNGTIFELGYVQGPEIAYYITRSASPIYLEASDLRNSKLSDDKKQIKEKMESIKQTIMELEGMGVPFENIFNMTKRQTRVLKILEDL